MLSVKRNNFTSSFSTGMSFMHFSCLIDLTRPSSRKRWWHPTPVLLPGKSHGWRSLVGCSPWRHKELDTTEWLHFHFSLSCTGEGNSNPLQCSCLENPRDWGAWWAAVCGVAQSRTGLKQLSSSSSSSSSSSMPSACQGSWISAWLYHCHLRVLINPRFKFPHP